MRRRIAIITLGCVFLAGCQSAHSTPAPKQVTVTMTTTATRTVTVSVTPSVAVSTTTVPRTQEGGGSLEDSEPYDGYSYEDDYEDDYDSGVGGYYRSEPKLFMHRNPGNNVAPKLPSQKRYNSTPNHSGGSKNSGGTGSNTGNGTGSSSGKSSSGTSSGSGRSSSGGSSGGGSRRR